MKVDCLLTAMRHLLQEPVFQDEQHQADLAGRPEEASIRPDGAAQAFCWLLPCLVALAAVTANTWIYYTHAQREYLLVAQES